MSDSTVKILREQLITRIALLLYQHRSVSWTPENLLTYVGGMSDKLFDALSAMKKRDLIDGTTMIFLTDSGVEYVSGLSQNVDVVPPSTCRKFKDEALLGIVEYKNTHTGWMVTEQSQLTVAALPTAHTPVTLTTPEDMMVKRQRALIGKQKMAERIKCSVKELETYIEDERLRYCKACESIELFDRKGKGRWQPVCRKCRKKRRG
jgi:hypothetical protein